MFTKTYTLSFSWVVIQSLKWKTPKLLKPIFLWPMTLIEISDHFHYFNSILYALFHINLNMDQFTSLKQFAKDSVTFVRRCRKPDWPEFKKTVAVIGVGFAIHWILCQAHSHSSQHHHCWKYLILDWFLHFDLFSIKLSNV